MKTPNKPISPLYFGPDEIKPEFRSDDPWEVHLFVRGQNISDV